MKIVVAGAVGLVLGDIDCVRGRMVGGYERGGGVVVWWCGCCDERTC